ncbi:MAG: hypothetical protein IIA91_07675 [Chloroflexi bacterium]|nr:hypothetical protein [Chloroflexota bacterium]
MNRWSLAAALLLALSPALFWSMSRPHALAGGAVPFEIPPIIVCDDASYFLSGAFRTKLNEHVNASGDTVITGVQIPTGMVAEDGDGNVFRVVGVIHGRVTLDADTGRGQASSTTVLRIVGRGRGTVGTVWTAMHIDADGVVESSDNGSCALVLVQKPVMFVVIGSCIDFGEGCP